MRCESAVLLLVVLLETVILPVRSQFQFTLPPPEEGSSSPHNFEDSEGNPVDTPRGIFHYSDTEQDVQSRFKIPDFQEMDPLRIAQDLMSAAAKAQTRRKSLGGFNIPLPIGTSPMNLQVSSDTRSGISMSEDRENVTEQVPAGPAKEAFEKAKSVCLHSNAESCDEALDTYYRVKYGSSLMPSTSGNDGATEMASMIVPGLGRKLEELTAETSAPPDHETPEARHFHEQRYSTPPRLPPRSSSSTSTVNRIRGFLDRIN